MKIFKAIKKGFTLVELVIVIAVIAVLSAVLIPVFGNVVKDSRVSALKASLKTCTSNLIMYATMNQVDYYTPTVIRDFLKSEGIKGLTSEDSEFCEDGYSIWYNQENYNLFLVKNEDLADFINTGSNSASVSGGNTATFAADIFGNVADATQGANSDIGASNQLRRLPRRPEAITPNENLLLLATDENNHCVLEAIETMYTGLDIIAVNNDLNTVISKVATLLDQSSLLKYVGSGWNSVSYTEKFDPATTAWLTDSGKLITGAKFETSGDQIIANISNIVVSPNLGASTDDISDEITGDIYVNGVKQEGAILNVSCVIEIASTYNVKLGTVFYDKFSARGVSIVISGNVSFTDQAISAGVTKGTSSVSTVTGGGGNISSSVASGGSASSGGATKIPKSTISPEEFAKWTSTKDDNGNPIVSCSSVSKAYDVNNNEIGTYVSVKTAEGKYIRETLSADKLEEYFKTNKVKVDGQDKTVQYKYNTTSLALNVSACLTKMGLNNTDTIRMVKVVNDAYNSISTTSVYVEYERNGVAYGKIVNFGVGYITSFNHYYRYYNTQFANSQTGENMTPTYFAINGESSATNAGSLAIKLPNGALNLQNYKNDDFTIEVYYNNSTVYYKENTSDLGLSKYYEEKATKLAETKSKVTWKKVDGGTKLTDGSYLVTFPMFDRIGSVEDSTHYVNTVQINRIVIKDKDNKILIVKYL